MQLYLIRHTTPDVPKGTCYGWTDVPVKSNFPEEAHTTSMALKGITFDAIYSSPLTRARRLAEACGYSSPIIDERLKEMNMGDWEMQRYDDITDPYLQEWYSDYLHLPTPHGESFPQLYQRVKSFLDEVRQLPHRRIAVFCHGGVIACAAVYAGLYPASEAFSRLTPYGGHLVIELEAMHSA
jgi:alpha-ribazole phosphatase